MGRSVVIMTPNGGNDRFACANIQPDRDIFKFVVIRKPRKFVAYVFKNVFDCLETDENFVQ